jgi:hypothetical protein
MRSWFKAGPWQGSKGFLAAAAATAVLASIADPFAPAFADTYPDRAIKW